MVLTLKLKLQLASVIFKTTIDDFGINRRQ